MSDLVVDLNSIRVYLRIVLNVFAILMFFFMCYCIDNVYYYDNLSIAKWYSILHYFGDIIFFEKMYIFVY